MTQIKLRRTLFVIAHAIGELKPNHTLDTGRVLAIILGACLIYHADTFSSVFTVRTLSVIPLFISSLIFIAGGLAVAGLWLKKLWGYIPAYFFIPAITMFSDISILPLLPKLFPTDFQAWSIVVSNLGVLLFSVWSLLHKMKAP